MVAGPGGAAGAPESLSRRRALTGAGAAALALLVAGCGGRGTHAEKADLFSQASEERDADALLLDGALALELRLAAAYDAIAGRVSGSAAALVRRIAAQEAAHAQALSKAIEGLGGPPAPTSPAPSFAPPRSPQAALRLAHSEENRAIAFYIDALPKLSADNMLRPRIAAIVANEAEHLALLAGAIGEPQIPQSIVRGEAS